MTIGPWTRDEWAAAATVANAVLVLVLVAATIYYARQTKRTVDELAEARVASSLPALHWQLHPGSATVGSREGDRLQLTIAILLTNVGPGPARLLAFDAKIEGRGPLNAPELSIPSTLPERKRIELRLEQIRAARDYPGQCTIRIWFRYTDLHALRTYETTCTLIAAWAPGLAQLISFDADERSPAQRRVK